LPRVECPYGEGVIGFDIPDRCLGEISSPREWDGTETGPPGLPCESGNPAGGKDTKHLVVAALKNPIGSPRLGELAAGRKRIAVIIDDITRDTPTSLMLPHVIEELVRGGVAPGDIRIVIALGTHRTMTESEIEQKVGPELAGRHQIVNTPCHDPDAFVFMGDGGGIPAWVNRAVAEADLRVAVGSITPHMDAGFSGGAKMILPGVCNARTVDAFHARQAELSGSQLGVEDAPLRLQLEAFVGERVRLDFIVNVVTDGRGGIRRCVAGHFIEAHRRGVGYARDAYGVTVSKRYPIVIASAFPAQIDLWQSTKAIASGELMTADGGTLVLLAHCAEGEGPHPEFAEYIGTDPDRLVGMIRAGEAGDPVACALAVPISRIRRRIRIAVVSRGLSREVCAAMGFGYYETVDAAIEKELSALADPVKAVGVLTHGGVSLPVPR